MQESAFILRVCHMMGVEEQNGVRVSPCGTVCKQSYTGDWPNVSSDVLDANPENGNLEEELERIIMLADNISEKALSAAEDLAGDVPTKKRKGRKNSERSSVTSLVLKRSRKSLRSSCADKSSMVLHREPRLNPLAARAALAAAVTPLRQANQANLSGKSEGLNVHPEACKPGTSFIKTAKKNDRNIHGEKGQSTRASVRQNQQTTSAKINLRRRR